MNANQQFIVALIAVGLPGLGAFITSIVTLVRQGHIKAKMEENHIEARQAVQEVKASVNGVQDKLIAAANLQGHSDERENPTIGDRE